MPPHRTLIWPDCNNVRDLGGIPLPFGGRTRFGEILRADSLDRLTLGGWATAISSGVRTVIDLRSPSELMRSECGRRPDCVVTVQAPILDDADVDTTAELSQAASTEEAYYVILRRCAGRFVSALRTVARAETGIVIHCQAGRDRTGILSALVLGIAGASASDIAEDYHLTETQIWPIYQEILARTRNPDQRLLLERESRVSKETMLATLEYLRTQFGGAEAYVAASGLTQDEIERIRWRLVG